MGGNSHLRDWSLTTGRGGGGGQIGREGGVACEVLPLRKEDGGGGGRNGFNHAEGGPQKVLG